MGGKKGGGGSTQVKPTATQKAQEEVAWRQWQDYKNILRPAENNFMKKVDDLNSSRQYDGIAGTTNLGYQKQFGEARRGLADNLTASGGDPSSGRFNAVMDASKSDQVTGQIDTTTRGQVSQADKYIAGLQDVVALGAGQKADAMQNFNSLADNSLKKAQSDAQSAYAKQQGRASLVGAGLGAAGAFAMHRAGGTADGSSGTPKTPGTGANAIQSYNWQWRG
ncbi:hypothetical protein OYB12_20890 [Escherichia coli]|uniref:hypothetical protein n=1 Tax=Escherichia coli TaxID=562 RepID=UPI000DA56EF9|nr:hypothetical protein [Escherichia coli]ELF2535579.1 hypothetical protein [Escherichia coli]MCY6516959.1 hypothetical protein [Escherichia coli]MCY6745449.1 hypothetical protein [Escherichia coli]MDW9272803.1 hypothetical protein [Escherichia coli]SQS53187.1 Uncharacterised protein [Escherichia coli]